jgi:hypothetical protein
VEDTDDDDDDDDHDQKKNPNAAKASEPEPKPVGPKMPKRVASATINKSALYHFQK